MINYITLAAAVAISIVAAYYSISGLTAIFAAAVIPVAVMASILEIGKLVSVSWLYHNWYITPRLLQVYLISAILVLMFITSLGIFGFLSRAHIEQTLFSGDNIIEISVLDTQIKNKQKSIQNKETVINQLDEIVQALINARRIRGREGSVSVRKTQESDRKALTSAINYDIIDLDKLHKQKSLLQKEQLKLEAEIGPIKYIAEFFYGENAPKHILESSVRWIIVVIIFAFDPLAVLMLLAANIGLSKKKNSTSSILKQMAGQLQKKGKI
tara:strand:- start:3529 stop:4338 length:810 start_codon:yes stop_codon:yes gene_type:complete